MAKNYVSLTGPLLGIYFPVSDDWNEAQIRRALNTSRLKNLWCSVYPRKEVFSQIIAYGGQILPDNFINMLDYDSFEVEKAGKGEA